MQRVHPICHPTYPVLFPSRELRTRLLVKTNVGQRSGTAFEVAIGRQECQIEFDRRCRNPKVVLADVQSSYLVQVLELGIPIDKRTFLDREYQQIPQRPFEHFQLASSPAPLLRKRQYFTLGNNADDRLEVLPSQFEPGVDIAKRRRISHCKN